MFEINGVIWRVVVVPPNHPELKQPNGHWAIGCCNKTIKVIYISADVAYQPLFTQLLCHEVTHAAVESYGISLPNDEEEFLASFVSVYGDDIWRIVDNFIR